MTSSVAAVFALSAAAVVVPRWRRRPPRRLRSLREGSTRDAPPPDRRRFALPAFVPHLGRVLRSLVGRSPDGEADRRVGLVVLGLVALVPIHPLLAVVVVGAGLARPVVRARNVRRAQQRAVRDELPDLVELFRLAAGAGLTVPLAVDAVSRHVGGCFAAPLAEVRGRVVGGARVSDALDALVEAGEAVRPLVSAQVSSDREGAPLGPSLERVAGDARLVRRRAAEEDARRLPVQLLFPLVACILPAFGLLTVVPLLAGALPSLGS